MVKTAKQTKRQLQRERAEARAAARRRAERRRRLGWALGGLAVAAAVALGVVALVGNQDDGAEPAPAAQVVIDGPARSEPLARGERVPGFSGPGLFGGTVDWADFADAPAVLSIWAPWCPHCQVELPILDRVMKDFPDVGLVTVVTSIGDKPGPAPEDFMRDNGLTFATAVDDDEGTLAKGLGVPGFPTVYFVSSDGTVAFVGSGEIDEATLRSTISSLS